MQASIVSRFLSRAKLYSKLGTSVFMSLVLVVSMSSSALASTVYTTYSTTSPTSYGTPGQMTVANGKIWYLENTSSSPSKNHYIGSMTISGTVLADYDIDRPSSPMNPTIRSITTGSDGNVWFVGQASTSTVVGSLNTTTGVVTYYSQPSSVGWGSTNIVSASDGNLWYGVKGAAGAMAPTYFVKVNPSTGVSTVGYAEGDYNANVTSLANGPSGSLSYTDAYMYNHRVSSFSVGGTWGGSVTIPGMYSYPGGLISDASGNRWLLESNKIAKITPAGVLTEYTLPTGMGATNLVAGSDNAVWFIALNGSTQNIGRITISGNISQYTLPGGVTNVSSLVLAPDDNIWFSTNASSGELVKVGYY